MRKTKKMEDEIIDLKSVSGRYTNNNEKSNSCKNNIILRLIILLIISLTFNFLFFLNNNNQNRVIPSSQPKIVPLIKKKIDKFKNILKIKKTDMIFNTYNIHMDNIEDFYKSQILFLLPGNLCPNRNLKTFFFKPIYPLISPKNIKFQEKNISLKLIDKKENAPTVYTNEPGGIREILLAKTGIKLNTEMSVNNLYMTKYEISKIFAKNMNNIINSKYQKINRFYNFDEYVSKSLLYINYKPFHDKFPNDYNYMLETYSYPKEQKKIEKKFGDYKLEKNDDIWMVKPNMASLGFQISILTNFTNIKLKNFLITKYLYNPHLIKGYKYDLRFHGLVSTIKPLKLYLYNEGLVRLASEKYNFSITAPHNKYVFLTNLFINQKNKKKFIYPKNMKDMEESNLWNLETFQKYCARNNINYLKLVIYLLK